MLLPENIDLSHSEKYVLSVRLSSTELFFCIHCPSDANVFYSQKILFSKNLSLIENIKKIFFEINLLTHPFKKTVITVVSEHFTMVPDIYFDKNQIKLYYDFNIYDVSKTVLSNYCETESLHLIFGMDVDVNSFLIRNLWNPDFVSHASTLISYFARYKCEKLRRRCFVDFHDQVITMICFSSGNLLSANLFPNINVYDALYFIVSVWEKLPLNQLDDLLFLSGNLNSNEETVESLRTLIKNVSVVDFPIFPVIPKGENITLPTDIIISLCE